MTTTIRAAAGILLWLHFILEPASAQNCYYPNGDVSTTDAACSSSGDSACCPNNWECLSNGICYDPTNEYFNRNTCTDQSWESSDCPQYCTANNTAAGNEALKQCDDGSWCCDGDRIHMDCCTMDDPAVIDVPGWTTVTKITSVPSPTSVASKTSSSSTTSSSSSSTTTTSSTSDSSSTADSSSTTTEATASDSTSDGPTTSSASAAATSSSTDPAASSNGSSSKNLAIGLGVGIPLLALAAGLGALLLWSRKKKAKQEPPTSDRLHPGDPDMVDMYAHGKDAQEADGMPVAVNGKERPPSELIGNNHFLPTSQPSPTVSHTSSMSRFSNPPQYSPNPSLSRGGAGGGLFVVNPGSPLSDVDETPEPQELPPEGNPPRDTARRSVPTPTSNVRTSAYEPYGRAYGPVATTYVPSPNPSPDNVDREGEGPKIDGLVEGEQKPLGPRPQQQKRNDELMLD
ncbi:hypothetical protein HII31_03358 [Pseudocercospora fuligena]|uniref:Mid2 domain-containing protein n=1 Tax=Pseudocercospora fuligena TaxID=685502 RepID=A0A8H6RQ42_9PEZI|nr:hypothetical protein HII31_03358 [Pseudocercospora fuligena]